MSLPILPGDPSASARLGDALWLLFLACLVYTAMSTWMGSGERMVKIVR